MLTAAIPANTTARPTSIHGGSAGTPGVTRSVAVAAVPVGTPVPVTDDVVLTMSPGVVACMRMGTIHDAPGPSVVPENDQPLPLKLATPAEHVYDPTTSGTRPAGYVSLKEIPVTVKEFGLLTVTVIVVVWLPPTATVDGLKLFAIVSASD
jgi:hypothetical protein